MNKKLVREQCKEFPIYKNEITYFFKDHSGRIHRERRKSFHIIAKCYKLSKSVHNSAIGN